MEHLLPALQKSPLFAGIEAGYLAGLLGCLSARSKAFGRQRYILRAGEPVGAVGVVCAGAVQVTREDFTGNRTILADLAPGDLFAEAFACAGADVLPVNVVAVEDSEIVLIDYRKIITTCPSTTCVFHGRLIENMLGILARKNVLLNGKIDILSRRSTREKLIAYLSAQAQAAGSSRFTVPYRRQELADYLCVERSAMTTELGRMKRDGLIDFDRQDFVLKADTES